MRFLVHAWLVAVVLCSAGCQREKSDSPATPEPTSKPVGELTSEPASEPVGEGVVSTRANNKAHALTMPHDAEQQQRAQQARERRASLAAIPEDRARAFFNGWLAVQNSGDLAAYQALYAADMQGIRRSGEKTVRLDRAAWIRERGRMFQKPMVVSAERISFVMQPSGLHMYFTQTWESGSYKDVGRKVLVLTRREPEREQLAIRYEEMLDSKILPPTVARAGPVVGSKTPPPASAVNLPHGVGLGSRAGHELSLAFVKDGIIYMARVAQDIGVGPVTMVDSSIDAASGITMAAMAERAVAARSLPPPLARVRGMSVQLFDDDLQELCQAKVSQEFKLLAQDWLQKEAYDEDALAELWSQNQFYVVAALEGANADCLAKARYARDAGLPKRPVATTFDVPARAVKLLEAELAEMVEGDHHHDGEAAEQMTKDASWFEYPKARTVLTVIDKHVFDTCDTQERYDFSAALATLGDNGFWDFDSLFDTEQQESFAFAADIDGDDIIEVVTSRGVYTEGSGYQVWLPDLRVYWPPGLGCDGCDGDDC